MLTDLRGTRLAGRSLGHVTVAGSSSSSSVFDGSSPFMAASIYVLFVGFLGPPLATPMPSAFYSLFPFSHASSPLPRHTSLRTTHTLPSHATLPSRPLLWSQSAHRTLSAYPSFPRTKRLSLAFKLSKRSSHQTSLRCFQTITSFLAPNLSPLLSNHLNFPRTTQLFLLSL